MFSCKKEKGIYDDEIIIGRNTDFEFTASVDENILLIPGHLKNLTYGKAGIVIAIPISGQGIFNPASQELTITYSGDETYEDIVLKYTFVEKLKKVTAAQ